MVYLSTVSHLIKEKTVKECLGQHRNLRQMGYFFMPQISIVISSECQHRLGQNFGKKVVSYLKSFLLKS